MFSEPCWDAIYWDSNKKTISEADKLKNYYNNINSLEKDNSEISKQIEVLQKKQEENNLKIEENLKKIDSLIKTKKKVLKP